MENPRQAGRGACLRGQPARLPGPDPGGSGVSVRLEPESCAGSAPLRAPAGKACSGPAAAARGLLRGQLAGTHGGGSRPGASLARPAAYSSMRTTRYTLPTPSPTGRSIRAGRSASESAMRRPAGFASSSGFRGPTRATSPGQAQSSWLPTAKATSMPGNRSVARSRSTIELMRLGDSISSQS